MEQPTMLRPSDLASSLKRSYSSRARPILPTSAAMGLDSLSTTAATAAGVRKRKRNAVSDVLARQQILSALVRAQNAEGQSENPVDKAFYVHVTGCDKDEDDDRACLEDNCALGKKCLRHFQRCRKADCILCVEARLIQTIDREGLKSDEDRLRMSGWRSRLQAVNDETREFVPYFNTCVQELNQAHANNSPFIHSIRERFQAARALVLQSEKRYSNLCTEIYSRWITTEGDDDNEAMEEENPRTTSYSLNTSNINSSDLMFAELHDSPLMRHHKTPPPLSPLPMPAEVDSDEPGDDRESSTESSSWRCPEEDQRTRLRVVGRIFEWSKAHNQNKEILDDDALLESAKRVEALLYSKAGSKQEYEEEAALMCRLCEE